MPTEIALDFCSLEFACYDRWWGRRISQVDEITEALIEVENEENQ